MIIAALTAFYLASNWMLCEGLHNNLALTPPMGWLSWGRFRCNVNCVKFPKECISEWLIRDMADRMVSDGYLSAGYNYVIIDDCWLAKYRDSYGRLQYDEDRFPSGLRNLSDYIHSLGLKFGLYEDYGEKTCEGYPGILHETMELDSQTFAYWGVDYVKIDACFSEPLLMDKGFEALGRWLKNTGRPMVYSCSWPAYQIFTGMSPNFTAAALTCNLWRSYTDIQDSWHSVRGIINFYAEHQEELAPYAGPGHWNDPDMLIVGNYGLSYEQAKVQMAVWAIIAAPLIMSHDLRTVHPEFRKIILSPQLIQISQDPLGIQGKRIYFDRRDRYEVWTRPVMPVTMSRVSWAILIINLDDVGEPSSISFPMKYTKIGEELYLYCFKDLMDMQSKVEFDIYGNLLTRIPPLAKPVSWGSQKSLSKKRIRFSYKNKCNICPKILYSFLGKSLPHGNELYSYTLYTWAPENKKLTKWENLLRMKIFKATLCKKG